MTYAYVLPKRVDNKTLHHAYQHARVQAAIHMANTGDPMPVTTLEYRAEEDRFAVGFSTAATDTSDMVSNDELRVVGLAASEYTARQMYTDDGRPLPAWINADPQTKGRWCEAARVELGGGTVSWFTLALATERAYMDAEFLREHS